MRIVLTGGGTGGHIYPAVAIGRHMQQQNPSTELLYIGTKKGMESRVIPELSIPFETIDITGFKRKLSFDNVRTVIRFLKGVSHSKKLLKQFKPDVVVGTGGFVCGPVVYAATRLGIPTFIHEQNAIPGLTNQFLTRFVSHVGVSFEDSMPHFARAKQVSFTGNPCGTQVLAAMPGRGRKSLDLDANDRYVLIVGGSRGARTFNEAIVEMAPKLTQLDNMKVVFVTGHSYYEATSKLLQNSEAVLKKQLILVPYLNNMSEVLTDATMVVSRSGASSLAELTALGKPSILIPSPNVTNNHQEANARSLENVGAAEVILERDLTGELLFQDIKEKVENQTTLNKMSEASKFLAVPDSADRIAIALGRIMKK